MADFERAIVKVLVREGGSRISDDPTDNGGLTKFGISQASYPNVDIRNLTESGAREIYKKDYWDKIKGDGITSQLVAESIFDSCVNMGVRTFVRLTQNAMGVTNADGIVGNATLSAINMAAEELVLLRLALAKVIRYAEICNRDRSQVKFMRGWINRIIEGLK